MKNIFKFLTELKENNNREWFQDNKAFYESAKNEFETYVNQLIPQIRRIDKSIDVVSAKQCVYRIYKDLRFSRNRIPYKTNFGAYISHGGRKSIYAGYYIQIEPDNSFVGGGLYQPKSDILKTIREDISNNSSEIKEILENEKFKQFFDKIVGKKLKTSPRGFPGNDENIYLLRNKSFAVIHNLSDEFLLSENWLEEVIKIFKIQKPFNDYLNEVIGLNYTL